VTPAKEKALKAKQREEKRAKRAAEKEAAKEKPPKQQATQANNGNRAEDETDAQIEQRIMFGLTYNRVRFHLRFVSLNNIEYSLCFLRSVVEFDTPQQKLPSHLRPVSASSLCVDALLGSFLNRCRRNRAGSRKRLQHLQAEVKLVNCRRLNCKPKWTAEDGHASTI
jgi:hypothetical protein